MVFSGFMIIAAATAAGFLLWRVARSGMTGKSDENTTVTLFKGVVFLGLVAALGAAKLWPLAFMTLIAAGAVTGIELWRGRAIRAGRDDEEHAVTRPRQARMSVAEASSILGVDNAARPADIKRAHKKLIAQLHPDKGGSDYLAAKINDARAVLLAAAPAAEASINEQTSKNDEPSR